MPNIEMEPTLLRVVRLCRGDARLKPRGSANNGNNGLQRAAERVEFSSGIEVHAHRLLGPPSFFTNHERIQRTAQTTTLRIRT
jgi:hypothetical protein